MSTPGANPWRESASRQLARGRNDGLVGVSENQDEQPTGASGNSESGTASQPAETAEVTETASDVDQEVQTIPIGMPTTAESWRELKRRADEPD